MTSVPADIEVEIDAGLLLAERPSLEDSTVFVKPLELQLLKAKEASPSEMKFLDSRETHIMKSTRDIA